MISLISLGKHFSVLELKLQAEEMGRREEHGPVPEEMMGHRERMSQGHQRACSERLEREERKQSSP